MRKLQAQEVRVGALDYYLFLWMWYIYKGRDLLTMSYLNNFDGGCLNKYKNIIKNRNKLYICVRARARFYL